MRVTTGLRILLSRNLFQNNFEGYFNSLCLARLIFIGHILKLKKHLSEVPEKLVKENIVKHYFKGKILKWINNGRSRGRSTCHQLLKHVRLHFDLLTNALHLKFDMFVNCYYATSTSCKIKPESSSFTI